MSHPARGRRRGFTLIELLVVIAIIAVLVGLLLPAVQKVREAAARAKCSNNLKQLGLALHTYHDTYDRYPQYYSTAADARKYTENWTFLLLPYIEQTAIHGQPVVNNSLADYNTLIRPQVVTTYLCPSSPVPPTTTDAGVVYNLTHYLGVAGKHRGDWRGAAYGGVGVDTGVIAVTVATSTGLASVPLKINVNSVTDGTSNTIAFGERPPVAHPTKAGFYDWGWGLAGNPNLDSIIWAVFRGDTQPGTSTAIDTPSLGASDVVGPCPFPMYFQAPAAPSPRRCDGYHMWSYHTGGANFAFADGSVRFLSYSAGTRVVPAMSTRAFGEVINE